MKAIAKAIAKKLLSTTSRLRLRAWAGAWSNWKRTSRILRNPKASPEVLVLELSNACNAKCVFCAYPFDRREKTFLDMETIRACADEFSALGGRIVHLTPMLGELFSDPMALEKICYVGSRGFDEVLVFTNASLIHRFSIADILKSGITQLVISTSPLDESIYKAIYRADNYSRVLQNIKEILRIYHEEKTKTVRSIELSFRSDRSLEACCSLPDYMREIAPYVHGDVKVSAMFEYDSWGGVIRKESLLPGMMLMKPAGFFGLTCLRMFHLQVGSDKTIRLCGCRIDVTSPEDDFSLGKLGELSLLEAFNSSRAKRMIRSFYDGTPCGLCKKCSFYAPLPYLTFSVPG